MCEKNLANYIENLYSDVNMVNKHKFIDDTKLLDFVPVVDQDVSRFLGILLKISGAKNILEIGTSIGYSTISMANVIKNTNGTIKTIEFDEIVVKQAKENFERFGVSDFIEVVIGDAKKVLPSLDEQFDLIFLDVDKRLYEPLLNDCVRLLSKNGVLVAEDTLFPVLDLDEKWHYLINPIEKFNQAVIDHENLESTILPIGDGVTIAVKKN